MDFYTLMNRYLLRTHRSPRALMKEVESDDELAGIIGHEIGHNENKHCSKHLRQTGLVKNVLGLDDNLNEGLAGLYELFFISFNQRQEYESDIAGVYLCYSAGYNPEKFNDFFARMEQKEHAEFTHYFLDSHPYSKQRITCINQYLAESKVKD